MQTHKKNLSALERQCRRLCRQVERLVADRGALLAHERLLRSWCSGLELLKDIYAEQGLGEDAWHHCQELESLLQQELSQLPQIPPGISAELLAVDSHGQHGTIAPAADPLAHFRRILSQPVLPEAATMAARGLAELMLVTTTQASVQQQLLKMLPAEEHGQILHKMQLIWERYFHAVLSIHLNGRSEVLEGIAVYNLETLQEDPQGFADSEQVIINRIQSLDLTPQQQEAISVGLETYHAHMGRILARRQQAQREQVEPPAATAAAAGVSACSLPRSPHTGNTSSTPHDAGCRQAGSICSSAGSGGGHTASSSSSHGRDDGAQVSSGESSRTLMGRLHQLQPTQDKFRMWQGLLYQEGHLRVLSLGWLSGCLSLTQLTTLSVLCWPFALRPLVFARAVSAQWHQQKQQKQQQQQHKQQISSRQHKHQQQMGMGASHTQQARAPSPA